MRWRAAVLGLVLGLGCVGGARAQDSGKLLATSGISQIEGAGGGGLAPWALITGYGTRDSIGANLHGTYAYLPDFGLGTAGVSVGVRDRVEVSYAHLWFQTRDAGRRLGIGQDYTFGLDVAGAKLRLIGDAVYDQDSWMPQVSAGVQLKSADSHAVLRAIGARSNDGADFYLAATKLFLAQSLLVNATVRATQANQFGFLGFGGDRVKGYSAQLEASTAVLLSRQLALGAEVRTKPDNLRFAQEGPAADAFVTYFMNKNFSGTLAFLAAGPIARQGGQNGVLVSIQGGF